ncbi:hypothetical protein H920_01792 [Fukomys damarensis]|uniref:Uncharacterized protein n=1 Tax=Fukomys damarensis TaxID=885580 RepID=A0A091DXH2_FUKDA|nr:hypothetical protein H920_01792 [Fukomys damarensis]
MEPSSPRLERVGLLSAAGIWQRTCVSPRASAATFGAERADAGPGGAQSPSHQAAGLQKMLWPQLGTQQQRRVHGGQEAFCCADCGCHFPHRCTGQAPARPQDQWSCSSWLLSYGSGWLPQPGHGCERNHTAKPPPWMNCRQHPITNKQEPMLVLELCKGPGTLKGIVPSTCSHLGAFGSRGTPRKSRKWPEETYRIYDPFSLGVQSFFKDIGKQWIDPETTCCLRSFYPQRSCLYCATTQTFFTGTETIRQGDTALVSGYCATHRTAYSWCRRPD